MERERETVSRGTVHDEPLSETVVHEDVPGAATRATARDPLSWGPIWAGVLTAFGIFFILSLVALAGGLQAVDLGAGRGEDVPVNAIAAIVTGIFLVIAFFSGGFVASWSADLVDEGRGVLHGFLVWALFVILLLVFAAFGLGSAFGAAGELFAGEFSSEAVRDVEVDAQQLLEAFQDAAWQTLFAVVLAMASAILGGFVGTREEFSRRWTEYTTRVRVR